MVKLINRTIYFITGFNIKSELDKVLAMDHWTRQMIANDQKIKFEKLSIIAGNSEYYRNYKGKELKDYPIMLREEFKKNHESLKTNIRKPYSIQHTSGSTSTPVDHLVSKEMLLAKRVSHQKVLYWNDLPRESREFKIGGLKTNPYTYTYYFFKNKRYIHSFKIAEDSVNRIIRKYNSFKPSVLYGYPSAINNLIQYAEKRGIYLHHPKVVITHAELLSPQFADKVRSTFPEARVLNQYWATEANIAETCPEGNLHVDEDTVICETINVNEEGFGDLLITNLYSYDLPIIRYRIGDRVKFSNFECPCRRKSRVLENIAGRDIDTMHLPDGRNIPVTAIYFSRYAKNILAYQMVYFKKQALVEFRYVPQNEDESIEEDKITDHLEKDYGLSCRFVKVKEVEYTPGGKFKLMIENNESDNIG